MLFEIAMAKKLVCFLYGYSEESIIDFRIGLVKEDISPEDMLDPKTAPKLHFILNKKEHTLTVEDLFCQVESIVFIAANTQASLDKSEGASWTTGSLIYNLIITYAPYTKCGKYVDIRCPHCGNIEEWSADEQRWHVQHFELIDVEIEKKTGVETPDNMTFYRCLECMDSFAVQDMFQPTPYDGQNSDDSEEEASD